MKQIQLISAIIIVMLNVNGHRALIFNLKQQQQRNEYMTCTEILFAINTGESVRVLTNQVV